MEWEIDVKALRRQMGRLSMWLRRPGVRLCLVIPNVEAAVWWKYRRRWWTVTRWEKFKVAATRGIGGFDFLWWSITFPITRKAR